MSGRRGLIALTAGCCLAFGVASIEAATTGAAASGSSTPTAPQQLTNAYPLGPQRLCCSAQTGSARTGSARTGSGQTGTRSSSISPARTRPAAKAGGGGSNGVSAVLFIGLGLAAVLLVAGVAAVLRTRRRFPRVLANRSWAQAPAAYSNGAAASSSISAERASRAGPFLDSSRSPLARATEAEVVEYRRLDEDGDASSAFNLGVVLHHRGELAGAVAAYERAEERGDPDAAFNLGVLLYQAGDLDAAVACWRRSAGRGHVRAAANLLFVSRRRRQMGRDELGDSDSERGPNTPRFADFEELAYQRADESDSANGAFNRGVILHQQGDTAGARAAYVRAEERGDPDAAFNLGVLLYEAGDLDGAEAAWRRGVKRGHPQAATNLEFLLRRRHGLQTAGLAGDGGAER